MLFRSCDYRGKGLSLNICILGQRVAAVLLPAAQSRDPRSRQRCLSAPNSLMHQVQTWSPWPQLPPDCVPDHFKLFIFLSYTYECLAGMYVPHHIAAEVKMIALDFLELEDVFPVANVSYSHISPICGPFKFFIWFCLLVRFCLRRLSLCSSRCPGTLYVGHTGFEFTEIRLWESPGYCN